MNRSLQQLLVIIGSVIIFVLLFSLCNPFKREVFLLNDPQIDHFIQDGDDVRGVVDILWLIDNSGSMATSQQNLANNFNSFINRFTSGTTNEMLDFQMAVITTDQLQEDGRLVSNKILTREDALTDQAKFIQDFQDLVRVGTEGSPFECDLMPALRATQRSENQHFFREDAMLVINILSDEADMSTHFRRQMESLIRNSGPDSDIPTGDYHTFFELTGYIEPPEEMLDQDVAYFVKALKNFKSGRRLMINSIVNTQDNSNFSGMIVGVEGKQQMEASQMTGGQIADINGDFAETLTHLGTSISQLASSFALSRKADGDDRMIVSVNNEEVSDWMYNPELQTIEFINGYVPPAGAEIEVQYEVFYEYDGF